MRGRRKTISLRTFLYRSGACLRARRVVRGRPASRVLFEEIRDYSDPLLGGLGKEWLAWLHSAVDVALMCSRHDQSCSRRAHAHLPVRLSVHLSAYLNARSPDYMTWDDWALVLEAVGVAVKGT